MEELSLLCTRSYTTYKVRVKAYDRLAFRNRAWNVSLISLSVGLTVASVGILTYPNMYGREGATLLATLAVMQLSASLVVAGLDYGARSRNMFTSYRDVQRLSVKAEALKLGGSFAVEEVRLLSDQYQSLLDNSENQSHADYIKMQRDEERIGRQRSGEGRKFEFTLDRSRSTARVAASGLLSALPLVTLLVPFMILYPFVTRILDGR